MDKLGRIYILERSGHALRMVDPNGRIHTVAGTGKRGRVDGPALQAEFNSPKHLCLDHDGRVLIADEGNGLIRCYDPETKKVATILGDGKSRPAVALKQPHGVCMDHGQLVVLDSGNDRVLRMPWPSDGFVELFNGRDLSGWRLVNTAPSTWTYNDEGLLVCSGKPIGELRTEKMYQNFILELEWRHLVPKGNAGVFVWADDITAKGVPFHRGVEVQVLENAYGNTGSHTTHGDIFPIHGAMMTPVNGRRGSRAFPIENRSHPSPQWNHYRIVCIDGEISLAVNGKIVTRGYQASPRKGYICLESEGGVVHYRNVRIKELPGGDLPAEQVAVSERGFQSLYNGLDLNNWNIGDQDQAAWRANDWILQYRPDETVISEGKKDLATSGLATRQAWADYDFIVDIKPLQADRGVTILPHGDRLGVRLPIEQRGAGSRAASESMATHRGRRARRYIAVEHRWESA